MLLTSVRVRKVFRDIWSNRSKTIMIVVATAVGVFAFGMLMQTWAIMDRDMDQSYAERNPAQATLLVDGLDDDTIEMVRRMPTIQAAQGWSLTRARVWTKTGGWKVLVLMAVDDLTKITVNQIRPQAGQWPPPTHTMLLERASLTPIGAAIGEKILIETPDGKRRSVPVTGTVHDLSQAPGELTDIAFYGFITLDTAKALGLSDLYTQVTMTVRDTATNVTYIRQVAQEVKKRLEKEGHTVLGISVPTPGEHIFYNVTQSLFLILNILGIFTLVFTALLIINTISGLLANHVSQIGVMKAIGAPYRDIVAMYSGIILVFSLLALLIAIPFGVIGAALLSARVARLLNYDVHPWQMSPQVVLWQIGAGLFTPLAAALLPIVRSARITVREAISNNNLDLFGSGLIDHLLGYLQRGSAAMRYALRNMFRRKVRLALTLCALAVGGSLFITVLNTIAALNNTIDTDTSAYWQQDITVNLQDLYRRERVVSTAMAIPNVTYAEGWHTQMAFRLDAEGRESREDMAIFGVPPTSAFIRPTLLAGRWLRPDDTNAIVMNVHTLKKDSSLSIGGPLTLKINGRESTWQVVGLVTTQLIGFTEIRGELAMAYVTDTALSRALGAVGKVNRVVLSVAGPAAQDEKVLITQLEDTFDQHGLRIRRIDTNMQFRQLATRLIGILTLLLGFAAVLFAAVGGLSLTSTMTLNVLERIREIGVLRAIGGPNHTVRGIILYEGAAVGLLSWFLGTLFSWPVSLLMNYALGQAFFAVPLHSTYPLYAPLAWLLLAVTIALLASYVPARNAAKLSIRETLAYT